MEKFIEYLPLLIPIILIQLGLTVAALVHIFTHRNYRVGTRALWVVLSFLQIIGPIAYFVFGRGEDRIRDEDRD